MHQHHTVMRWLCLSLLVAALAFSQTSLPTTAQSAPQPGATAIAIHEAVQVADNVAVIPPPHVKPGEQITIGDQVTISIASVTITTTSPLPQGIVDVAYGPVQLTATGSTAPYTWAIKPGSTLPSGLSMTPEGLISGRPTAAGSYGFDVLCTSKANLTGTASFTLVVNNPAPHLSALVPAHAAAGEKGLSMTLTGTGFVAGSRVAWTFGGTTTTMAPTLTVKGTELSVPVDGSLLVNPGVASVAVVNAQPGGGTSTPLSFVIDATPPLIAPNIAPGANAAGWNKTDVTVTWDVVDPESGIASSVGCGPTTVADDGTTVITCSATNGADLSASKSVSINLDKTPPSITCDQPDAQWHGQDVSLACTALDKTSGLLTSTDAGFALSTSVAADTETSNAATGTRQVCDSAGNCLTAGPIGGNQVDRKAPSITISSPAASTYTLNQVAPATYTCIDGGSGVATCAGPVPDGSNIDTASPATRTFAVNATDPVGNAAHQVVTYQVTYGVQLLYDPTKAARSGSTIPIKVYLADAAGKDVSSASITLVAGKVVLISTNVSGPVLDAGDANPDNGFRYDGTLGPSGGYVFNLKTTGLLSGTYEVQFIISGDPTPHTTSFQIR